MKRLSYASLFAVGFLYAACQNPIDQIDLGFKTELKPSLEVQFTPQSGQVPANMQVQLTGPDADKLVSTLNTRNFRTDESGLLKLSIPGTTNLSASQPLRFTVVAKASGYLDVVQPLEVSSLSPRTVDVPLLSQQSTEPVVQAKAQSSGTGVLNQTLQVSTPDLDAAQSSARLVAGTQLTDRDGAPLEGELTLTMNSLLDNPATGDVRLPEDGLIDAGSANGRVASAKSKLTSPVAAVNISAYNSKYRQALAASQPITLTLKTRKNAYNQVTGRAIQAGDLIPLFRYDLATGTWSEEKPGIVQQSSKGNKLELVAQVLKFGFYVAGYRSSTCAEGATFKVKSNFKDYDKKYLCRVSYVGKNGRDSALVSQFEQTLNNDQEIRVSNLVKNTSVRLTVLENAQDEKTGVSSNAVSSCGGQPGTIDVRGFVRKGDLMAFIIEFPCSNVNEKKLPETVTAQYRETGTKEWKDLVVLNRKDLNGGRIKGASYLLSKGQRYDFRLKIMTYTVEETNYLLDKDLYAVKVKVNDFCK